MWRTLDGALGAARQGMENQQVTGAATICSGGIRAVDDGGNPGTEWREIAGNERYLAPGIFLVLTRESALFKLLYVEQFRNSVQQAWLGLLRKAFLRV
jgi:hypothetical protein